jgi:hypothetical protein
MKSRKINNRMPRNSIYLAKTPIYIILEEVIQRQAEGTKDRFYGRT